MATRRPVHIDAISGNIRELVAGDTLGGITGGTSSGEVMTQDQFGANSTEMTLTGQPSFAGFNCSADGGVTVSLSRYSNNTAAANLALQKSRGLRASVANAAVGDFAGNVLFQVMQNGNFVNIANITARVATGFGATGPDSPGELILQTVPDGSGTQLDAIVIDSSQGSTFSGKAVSKSATAGVGYATGSGGAVTQLTSKATGVTLSRCCGAITLNNAALAAGTIVSFVLTNTAIAATDVMILNHISGGTPGSYALNARCGTGSATIDVRNNTAGSLSEAIVIQFALIKAVNA